MEGLDDLNDVLNDLASFDLEGYAQQVSQQKSNKPQIQRPSAPSSSNRAGSAVPSQQSTAFVEDLDDLDLDVPDLDSELSAPSKPSTQARGVVGSSGKSAADANVALDFSFAVAPTSTDDSLDIEDLDIDDIEDISVSDADLGIDFQLPPVSVAPSPVKTVQPSPSRTSSTAPPPGISPSASPRTPVRPPSRAGTGSSSSSSSSASPSMSARGSLAPKPEILDQLEIKKKKDDDENLSRSSFTFKDLAEDSGEWPDPVKVDKPVKQCTDGLEKLVITVVLADKSTKKVMATKDFTCQELLELACSKLHLWQTEFFQLAITESGDEDRWLDMRKTIEEESIKTRQEVQLKLRYLKQPKKIIDQASLRLFYLQTKQNIVQGNYPCPEKLAIQLASFQLQLNHGDYSPSRHRIGFLGDAIRDYLPRDVIGSNPTGYLEQRVYNLHKNLSGKSNLEVMEAYLEQSQQIQTYGSTIFTIKEKFGRIKKFAVAEDGIMISTDEDPKKFTFTRFKHLGGWSLTDDGFSIEITEPKSTLEFTASPRKSSNVIELLSAYYIFLLTADPSELPLIKMVQKPDNLPNPRMFMKPNTALKRRISDRTLSRLEIFKQKYVSESSVLDIFPNSNLLLQVDAALDQDLVLDRIVATNCEIDYKGLKAFTTAIVTALEYLPQEDQFFEENMAITELNLSDNPLIHNDNGPEDLGRLVIIDAWKLKFLILRNIGLTTRAAKLWKPYLSKNKWLEFIDVANNDLKDKGVPAIMKPLKGQEFCNRFDFSNNNLTGQVCYFLAIVLAKNQRISELRIGQNKIDEKGLTDLHQGLLRNKSLSVLDMSRCGLGASGGRLIIKWLESYNSLKELSLSGCNLGSSWGSAFVKILTSGTSALCAVDLEKNSLGAKATKGILDAVKQHSIVRDLNIAENEIDKKGAAVLGECIGSRAIPLRRLIVRDCGISKSSSSFIGQKVSENISIKVLDFSGNEIKDVDGARAWAESIRTNQSIEELRLNRCSFIPEGIELIMRGIAANTSIKKLYLDGNVKIGRAIWAPLQEVFAQNTTLEYISLRNIGVDVPIMTQFFSDPALRSRGLRLMDLLNNPLISRSPEAQDALKRASFNVLF